MPGTVKEWDTRPSVSEKFSITDLEPFSSALFCSRHLRPSAILKDGHNRRPSGSFTPRRHPTKRKKIEEDMEPLEELISLVLGPSSALYAYDDPASPITFPLPSSYCIPHCPMSHLIPPLLSSLFRPKTSPRSKLSYHPYIPVSPG